MADNKRETGARMHPAEPRQKGVPTGATKRDATHQEPGPFGSDAGDQIEVPNNDTQPDDDAPGTYDDARRTAEEQHPGEISRK